MTNATTVAGHSPVVPNRRTFLTQAASAMILGATAVPASSSTVDPILAAIEVHKAAVCATRTALDWHSELDHELPIEK